MTHTHTHTSYLSGCASKIETAGCADESETVFKAAVAEGEEEVAEDNEEEVETEEIAVDASSGFKLFASETSDIIKQI